MERKEWLFDINDNRVLIVSHRGRFSSSVMENTSLAFRLAIEEGADMVELDLEKTRDGVLVGHHDKDMSRLFHNSGKISDYTLEELQQMPLYNYVGEICEEKLETFSQILEQMKGQALLVLDKCWDEWDSVYRLLEQYDMKQQRL